MEQDQILEQAKEKMKKSLLSFGERLSALRTGRASVQQFEKIIVECYGSNSPLKQHANIHAPDPRQIIIQVWDTSILPDIEKAIRKNTVSLNPQNDGKTIRISIPPLTQETRQESVKLSKTYEEEAKVAIRNIRREANDKLKKMKQGNEIGEDELNDREQEVQKLTDSYIKQLDELHAIKSKEISDE